MIFWHAGLTMLIVWFVMRGNPRVDYRVVMLASLLPDIIDKPIGRLLFRERFDSGRLYAHTLLLNVALFCVLFFMRGRAKRQFVLVPISSLLHLAEDGMWSQPRIFWWPLFGAEFPRDPLDGGTLAFLNPLSDTGIVVQEAVGLLVLVWLFASHGMLSRAGMRRFLRTGMLETPKEAAA
ncbi:MAG TPA: metal-dependent hydrolase [Actinomycetota bacterium]|nr:metal-dependent hydrolase [Actinomycetota bacterium]